MADTRSSARSVLSLVLLLSPISLAAPLSVTPLPLDDAEQVEAYRFPLVTGGVEAEAINTWLQVQVLERYPFSTEIAPFERVGPDPHGWGIRRLDYQVTGNTPAYLSLAIDGDFLGAYDTQYQSHFTFDAGTGRPLDLADFFSKGGLSDFQARVQRQWRDEIRAVLSAPSELDDEDRQVQREHYENCLDVLKDSRTSWDFFVDDAGLHVRWQCGFGRAYRALDELGTLQAAGDAETLRPWLSDFGACALAGDRTSCPRTYGEKGVYFGRIDRHRIVLVLDGEDGGSYAYRNVGTPIPLRLTSRKNEALVLKWGGDTPAGREMFILEPEADGFRGVWMRRTDPAPFDVELMARPQP